MNKERNILWIKNEVKPFNIISNKYVDFKFDF